MDKSQIIEQFARKCRAAGLKVTPQRTAVYLALVSGDEHPSAEQVWKKVRKQMSNISLDTVNRTLLTLSEIGVAFMVESTGGARRFDGNLDSHQHFRCIKCQRIIDFHEEEFDNIETPANIRKKYVILRKTVYFEGICDVCQQNGKAGVNK